jgi:hypothetical protein
VKAEQSRFHNPPFGEKVGSSHVATGTIGLNLRPLSGLPGPALLTGRAVFSGAVDPNARACTSFFDHELGCAFS